MRIGIGILVGALLVSAGAACSQIDAGGSDELSGRSSGSESDPLKARIAKLTLEEGGLVKQRGEVSEKLSKAQAKYKGLVAKRQHALTVIEQNNQVMSSSVNGSAGNLKTVEDVSNEDFNNVVKEINAHNTAISQIDMRLGAIDQEVNKLTEQSISISSKLASIKKHRESKQIKVDQLKRQLNDLSSSYEGYWRCSSFANLMHGLLGSADASGPQEKAAAWNKVAERYEKCASLSDELESKRAGLNQGIKELAAANELLRKTLSGDSQKASAGSKSSVPLDATAGCYRLQSAGPLFKTPNTTDAWGPNSKPNASGFAIGSGALVYIHKRLPTGRLQVTAKSGSFLGRSGYVPESIARTKVDGTLCD